MAVTTDSPKPRTISCIVTDAMVEQADAAFPDPRQHVLRRRQQERRHFQDRDRRPPGRDQRDENPRRKRLAHDTPNASGAPSFRARCGLLIETGRCASSHVVLPRPVHPDCDFLSPKVTDYIFSVNSVQRFRVLPGNGLDLHRKIDRFERFQGDGAAGGYLLCGFILNANRACRHGAMRRREGLDQTR